MLFIYIELIIHYHICMLKSSFLLLWLMFGC